MQNLDRKFLVYSLASFLNLGIVALSRHEPLGVFMMARGLTAVIASLLMLRLMTGSLRFKIGFNMKQRFTWGGVGMALQVIGLATTPPFAYSLLSRATPIWFFWMKERRFNLTLIFMFAAIWIIPFSVLGANRVVLFSVLTFILATFFIALSQLNQVRGAANESRWLMPFAPALGSAIIGGVWALFTQGFSFSYMGIFSGLVMTGAYWLAQPLIVSKVTGGSNMILADVCAAVGIGLVDILRAPSLLKFFVVGISVFIFVGISKEIWKKDETFKSIAAHHR